MGAYVIGITGGMGMGKTSLAHEILRNNDYNYIAVDDVRRSIAGSDANKYMDLWDKIRDQVKQELQQRIEHADKPVLLEWVRFIEDDFMDLINEVIIVHCANAQRQERLSGGDLTAEQVADRISHQMNTDQLHEAFGEHDIPTHVFDTSYGIQPSKLNDLCGTLEASEFDDNTDFCLFRIPKKGGRVIWEVTNSCNYGCRYCIFSSTSRKPAEELDTERIYQTIDGLKAEGFTHIKVTGGEPFMRPDLIDILRYIERAGFKLDISTNAAFITEEVTQQLSALDLEMVHVSLDGHTQELQETIRGKRTYEPTMRGLNLLVNTGLYIRIGCVIYQNNQNELHNITKFCADLGCDEVIFSIMEPVGRMRNRANMLCDRPLQDMQDDIERLKTEYTGQIKVSGNFAETISEGCSTCPGGEKFLFIDHKGQVSPCTWVSEHRPNYIAQKTLHDHSVSDILKDNENQSFRNIVEDLAAAKLRCCPMQDLSSFKQAEEITALFKGSLKNNLYNNGRYSQFSPVYSFTTENIAGYINHLDLNNKSVLTVGASGDHMINAYAAGAAHAGNFDINGLAQYMAELKIVLLQHLNANDYITFFTGFDFRTYQRYREQLSLATRFFFDQAYKYFGQNGEDLGQSALLRSYQNRDQMIKNNPYLHNKDTYLKAQNACKDKAIEWNTQSVEQVAKNTQEQYDLILLSNISDYAHHMFEDNYLSQFRDTIIKPMAQKLNPGGKLVIGYVYDLCDTNQSSKRSDINKPALRQKVFGNDNAYSYKEIEIPSAWEGNNKDAILIWEHAA